MLKQEIININGKQLIKTYSDDNKYVIQIETGIKYIEAIDIPNKYTYMESIDTIEQEIVENEIIEEEQ